MQKHFPQHHATICRALDSVSDVLLVYGTVTAIITCLVTLVLFRQIHSSSCMMDILAFASFAAAPVSAAFWLASQQSNHWLAQPTLGDHCITRFGDTENSFGRETKRSVAVPREHRIAGQSCLQGAKTRYAMVSLGYWPYDAYATSLSSISSAKCSV